MAFETKSTTFIGQCFNIFAFNIKKEFSKIIDQLNNTISELEKDKNVTQKSIQKEINDLKKSVNDLSEKTKLMHKTVKKVIIKDTDKE